MFQYIVYRFAVAAFAFFLGSLVFYLWTERQRRIVKAYNEHEYQDAYAEEEVKAIEAAPSVVSQDALLSSRKAPDLSLLSRKRITTENERYFFNKLIRALPQYHVFTQVAFSAILKPADGLSKKDHYSIFGVFAQKRADYVVCERESLDIVAVIELDDSSHKNPEMDRKRDELLKTVGYTVHRFPKSTALSEADLAGIFKLDRT